MPVNQKRSNMELIMHALALLLRHEAEKLKPGVVPDPLYLARIARELTEREEELAAERTGETL